MHPTALTPETAPETCFHCAEPVTRPGRWQVEFDQQHLDVCCTGCQAVTQAIIGAGLGDYYRHREKPAELGAVPEDLATRLDALAVYDEPEVAERYLRPVESNRQATLESDTTTDDNTCVEVNLAVSGMHCGACVWLLERSVSRLPGVESARVNYATERARVRFDSARISLSGVLRRVGEIGYGAVPFDADTREVELARQSRTLMRRLFLAGLGMMQVMMFALPGYITAAGEIEHPYTQLLRWAALVLTVPVMLYSAQPFLQGAWRDLRIRRPGMDVPVAIGLVAAFSASVLSTVRGTGEIYFDSVCMFVFLLLGARYLEWSARRRAMRSLDAISAAAPDTAQRLLDDGRTEQVPAVRLAPGDAIVVNNGERIAADGRVLTGRSSVDQSLLTGESMPVPVAPGDTIPGGALLSGSPLTLEVLNTQAGSTLSIIEQLVDRGNLEKPRLVQAADRVASVFVSLLLGFAALIWLVWLQLDPTRAGTIAVAVLVVSCPCALSLATPAAIAAATGRLLRSHLLVTRGHALETLAQVTDVVFDKTGTLTRGQPALTAVDAASTLDCDQALQLAAWLESGSSHPLASALREAAAPLTRTDTLTPPLPGLGSVGWQALERTDDAAGQGVAARVSLDDHLLELRAGSAAWCDLPDTELQALPLATGSVVFLSSRQTDNPPGLLARFAFEDAVREEAPALLERLRERDLRLHLLSGDRPEPVERLAGQLGIEQPRAQARPDEKQAYVAALQARGARVLMIGDGINDAPVLASADVSLALSSATSLARTSADVISLGHGLTGVWPLLDCAWRTRRIVWQNLAWAASYNTLAIPAAALGWVPPWAAALGMAASSLLVAGNAIRLWH